MRSRWCLVLVPLLLISCMESKPVRRLEELEALKGKSEGEVVRVLGTPQVVDSSASSRERIWGYYQMMIRSEVDAKPRQRTVLLVFRKQDGNFSVDEVRVP